MESVLINAVSPKLNGVFGWISSEDEKSIRSNLLTTGSRIAEAGRMLRSRNGSHASGLELQWLPSGQLAIATSIGIGEPESRVEFCLELRPGWYFEADKDCATWVVEVSIQADGPSRYGMETVHSSETITRSQWEAVETLALEADRLIGLATEHPAEHWLSQAQR